MSLFGSDWILSNASKRFSLIFCFLFCLVVLPDLGFAENVSRQEAQNFLDLADSAINDLENAGFGTSFVSDLFELAERELSRNNFVVSITRSKQIISVREEAFAVYDDIFVMGNKIKSAYNQNLVGLEKVSDLFNQSKIEFAEERYSESRRFLGLAEVELESILAEQTVLDVLILSGKSFLSKNWAWLLGILILFILSGTVLYYFLRLRYLENRIVKTKLELIALKKMQKLTQKDRYTAKGMSKKIYRLRMEMYKTKQHDFELELPLLEKQLKELNELKKIKNWKLLDKLKRT